MDIFFEIIGVVAGLCVAIPSLPQIFRTIKSKDVKGLSSLMFWIWAIGGICWIIYGWHLGSRQMVVFNAISSLSSLTMLVLIWKYSKRKEQKSA